MAELDHDQRMRALELETAETKLKIKLKELEATGLRWTETFKNPVVLGAILTAFVGLNSAMISYVSSTTSASIERQRFQIDVEKFQVQLKADAEKSLRQFELDRARFESELLLKLMTAGDPDKAKANIEFVVSTGLLSKPERFLEALKPKPGGLTDVIVSAPGGAVRFPVQRTPKE